VAVRVRAWLRAVPLPPAGIKGGGNVTAQVRQRRLQGLQEQGHMGGVGRRDAPALGRAAA